MKVLFFNYEYPPLGGGAANASSYLLQEYAAYPDTQVDLVTSSPDNENHTTWISDRICIHALAIGKNGKNLHHQSQKDLLVYSLRSYWYAKKLLRKNEYDVIHAFFGVPCGVLAMRLGKKFGVPYIVSLRGADVPGYSERFSFLYNILTPLIRQVWRRASRVVSNSQGLKDLALQSAPLQVIDVIPNGVDTEKFFPAESQNTEQNPEQNRESWIITAGATRLTARKGLHLVIEALPELLTINPRVMFEIMGDGASLGRLQAKALELGIEGHVRFLGRISANKTAPYYQQAKVFILPSANEGMSNALLEALATGLPAIVTDTGGSSELVTDGENGFIIKRETAAIVAAVTKLLNNETTRVEMGKASRRRAEAQSWKQVAGEYNKLYEAAVTNHKKT